jgi:hypothetical protein
MKAEQPYRRSRRACNIKSPFFAQAARLSRQLFDRKEGVEHRMFSVEVQLVGRRERRSISSRSAAQRAGSACDREMPHRPALPGHDLLCAEPAARPARQGLRDSTALSRGLQRARRRAGGVEAPPEALTRFDQALRLDPITPITLSKPGDPSSDGVLSLVHTVIAGSSPECSRTVPFDAVSWQ